VTIEGLNALPAAEAVSALERCCGARAWAERMAASRPFESRAEILTCADRAWRRLGESVWREAFTHHPRIGDVAVLRERFASTAVWARGEQAGVAAADERTLAALAEGNRAYEARFGYVFIVCATGLKADQMLAMLNARLSNDAETEMRIAAEEQMKITRLRLEKLLDGTP